MVGLQQVRSSQWGWWGWASPTTLQTSDQGYSALYKLSVKQYSGVCGSLLLLALLSIGPPVKTNHFQSCVSFVLTRPSFVLSNERSGMYQTCEFLVALHQYVQKIGKPMRLPDLKTIV